MEELLLKFLLGNETWSLVADLNQNHAESILRFAVNWHRRRYGNATG